MGAQTILFRMPNGKPGAVTRLEHSTVEAGWLQDNTRAALFVAIDTTTRKFIPAKTSDKVYGILTRSYPEMTADDTSWPTYDSPLGVAPTMLNNRSVGILRSGYMTVPYEGTVEIEKGDPVYRIVNAVPGKPLGAFTDATDGDGKLVENCTYNGPALPGDVVEVIYNI